MQGSIKTITDKESFEKIFSNFFVANNVFLKTSNGNIKIEYLGYTDNLVAFQIPFLKNMPFSCMIFLRNGSVTIYTQLHHVEKQKDEVYTFEPVKMQLMNIARKEGRKNISQEEGSKQVLTITNLISDPIIQNDLVLQASKAEKIKIEVLAEIEHLFDRSKIFFCHEGSSDIRMKFFTENIFPLFVANIHQEPGIKFEKIHKIYMEHIYNKDYYLINRKQLVSEISIPILYKKRIPYGYIQINHTATIDKSTLAMIQKLSYAADFLMGEYNIFNPCQDKLLVSDISKSGLGLVFRERKYIRYFKEKKYALFDILLPDQHKLLITAIVRNISILENKIIKIGCQISNMNEADRNLYEKYL